MKNNTFYKNIENQVQLIADSYEYWFKKPILERYKIDEPFSKQIYEAPFVLVSHSTANDPVFNFANQKALDLWEYTWDEFTALPSRLSAEEIVVSERQKLLETIKVNGYINDYKGVRISKSGKRFYIINAMVFNLLDKNGTYTGQAALFDNWEIIKP